MKQVLKIYSFFTLVICSAAGFSPLNAQDLSSDYELLQSQAPIPRAILTTAYQKSEREINRQISDSDKKRDRKAKTDFILQTNFVLDQLMQSHLLLFNTPLNKLMEDIADELLKNDPDLREDLSFHVVKSSAVNAFATDRGDIFVTMGLLARMKTEAELAFILAHEIVHVEEKHSMELFTTNLELEKNQNRFGRESVDLLLRKSNFKKGAELEADEEGLKMLAATSYELKASNAVFNTLKFGHTTVMNDSLGREVFALPNIPIRDDLWLDDPTPIKALELDNKYGTHPDIDERIENAGNQMIDFKMEGRKEFVLYDEATFSQLVETANMELSMVYLTEQLYPEAIYHTSQLLKRYPENFYLQKNFVYGIYGIAQYGQVKNLRKVISSADRIQGELEKVHHFFDELSSKERTVFAAAHCWELYRKYPDDPQVELIARDAVEDVMLFSVDDDPEEFFKSAPLDSSVLTNATTFSRLAFADYMDNEEFLGFLEDGKKYRIRRDRRDEEMMTREGLKKKRKEDKDRVRKGVALDANKVVFVNPMYLKGRLALSGIQMDYVEGEILQSTLKDQIKAIGKDLDLRTDVVDINALRRKDDIEELRNIYLVEQWSDELYTHPDYMVSCFHNEAMELCEEMGTNYFAYVGVISMDNAAAAATEKLSILARSSLYGLFLLILPETAPMAVYKLFKKNNETFYYATVFDMTKYRKLLTDTNYMHQKDKPEVVKTNLYWSMHQMKKKKKKK